MKTREKRSLDHVKDLYLVGQWVKKRIQYRFSGKAYTLSNDDFPFLSPMVNLLNTVLPKVHEKKWFLKHIGPLLRGRPGGDHLQVKVVPVNAVVDKHAKAVMPYGLIDELIEKSGFRLILHECI